MPYGIAAGAIISAGAGALQNSQNKKNAASANAPFNALISDAEGVANQPYVPYTGALTAPITSNEQNAATLAGTDASLASQDFAAASTPFSQGALDKYMNPYSNLVTQAAQTNLNQNFNTQNATSVRKANMTDAFGYGRTAAMEQPAFNAYEQESGQLQVQGKAAAYNSALQEFNQQGAFDEGLGKSVGNASDNGVGALLSTGEDIRNAGTQADQAQYGEFLRGQNWSRNQIQPYIQAVTGVGKDLVQPQQSNILSDAIGGAVAGYGLAQGVGGTGGPSAGAIAGDAASIGPELQSQFSGAASSADADLNSDYNTTTYSNTGGAFGNPNSEDDLSNQTNGQTGLGLQSVAGGPG